MSEKCRDCGEIVEPSDPAVSRFTYVSGCGYRWGDRLAVAPEAVEARRTAVEAFLAAQRTRTPDERQQAPERSQEGHRA